MKKQWIFLGIATLVMPVLAQQANDVKKDGLARSKPLAEAQRKEHYKFLDKSLTQIGVGKEDKAKIRALQIEHRQKMKANMQRMNKARKTLSKLENSAASEAEVELAIQEIAAAQAEQLRILVSNRREMEKILGKEKYAQFMENARAQYSKHDRQSGSGIPPRPKHQALPSSPLGGYLRFMDRARERFLKTQIKEGKPPPTPEEYNRFMDRARAEYLESHRSSTPSTPPPQ